MEPVWPRDWRCPLAAGQRGDWRAILWFRP